MKIAVDAMGGDHGPAPIIEGALQAVAELGVEVMLVGDEVQLREHFKRLRVNDTRLTIHHGI